MAKFPKTQRRRSPGFEGLETRQLLTGHGLHLAINGASISQADFERLLRLKVTGIQASDRRIVQKLDDGSTVAVTLYGSGRLKSGSGDDTTIDPSTGAVNLVFDGTTNTTRIIANVWKPNGTPSKRVLALTGVRDADTAVGSQTGTGVDPVWAIVMPNFNLVKGSYVNLMGGILNINLKQIEGDTVMYLKEGVVPTTSSSTVSTITQGGASVGGVTNVTAVDQTVAVKAQEPGVDIQVQKVVAGPMGSPALGDPVMYTVDMTTNQLVRIKVDSVTGGGTVASIDPTFAVALPALATTAPAVGLAQDRTEELVLVSSGNTVLAYDAVTGASEGQFTVPQLASVDGIGSSQLGTMLTEKGGNGLSLDVHASLASGTAVGTPIVPQREFIFNGGVTGLAGSDSLYVDGAGHFDTAQPNLFQFGTAVYSLFGVESSRTAIPGFLSAYINAGANGLDPSPYVGTGSLDTRLARLLPPTSGSNYILQLFTPSTEARAGSLTLTSTHTFAGLSESYHPELTGTSGVAAQTGAAVINISGNALRILANQTRGLVYNVTGSINLVGVKRAVDSAFIGNPLNHVDIKVRKNTQLLSKQRGFNGVVTRGGVTVVRNLDPIGPLSLPVTG